MDDFLSDFYLIGTNFKQTVEINGIINGLGIFICVFFFSKMTEELDKGFV